ncbi:MAG TPA: DUF2269 family protein [Patescibacteria group bacterium]|nr:DUF2269 family protein [Patescibacteria group bacterium]
MITWFKVIVFLHIISAIIWIGAVIVLEILEWQTVHATRREQIASQTHRQNWFGKRVFAPASIATIVTGLIAVAIGNPAFKQFWVIVALVGVAVALGLGAGVIGRTMGKISQMLANPATTDEQIEQQFQFLKPFTFLDLAVLIYILFDMVMRPATANTGFLGVTVVYFAIVLVSIALARAKSHRPKIEFHDQPHT